MCNLHDWNFRALAYTSDAEGKSIFYDKAFTCFSNAEEEAIDKVKDIPFLLEDKISSEGGKYEKAADMWAVSLHWIRRTWTHLSSCSLMLWCLVT